MNIRRFVLFFVLAGFWAGCGEDTETARSDTKMPSDAGIASNVPTNTEALLSWLQAGEYKNWASESAPHASENHMWPEGGPEGRPDVLTYMNEPLTRSLDSGDGAHPVGSAAVKEHYVTDGDEVMMWTVMVKLEADSGDGEGWYWAMGNPMGVMEPADPVSRCADCHSQGNDFVTTSYPFEY